MEKVLDLGRNLELWKVKPDELREQDQNARVVPPEMFNRLQTTIGRDGRLESLPLVAQVGETFEIVSGHHRVRAARAAGLDEIFVLTDVSGLTRDQIIAKQLAHNAISGVDDPQVLKRLFEQIQDVEARLESFIDEEALDISPIMPVSVPPFSLDVRYSIMQLVFVDNDLQEFDEILDALEQQLDPSQETVLADRQIEHKWKEAVRGFAAAMEIKSLTAALMVLAEIAAEQCGFAINDHLPEPDAMKSLSQTVGSAVVPSDAADVISRAVDKMVKTGQVPSRERWQAIEIWAKAYLGE